MAVADLDGDSVPDVVVASQGGVSMLMGTGGGSFSPQVLIEGVASPGATSVVATDVDMDGNVDLVVGLYSGDVAVFYGNGRGEFSPQTIYSGAGTHSVAVADFDGDGAPDVAVANFRDSTISTLLNQGQRTFKSAGNASTGSAAYAIAIADVNGDGRLDIATSNFDGDHSVAVLLGNQDGTFQSATFFALKRDAMLLHSGTSTEISRQTSL